MHSSHAVFLIRELHRQELLSFAEQQRLVKLACMGPTCINSRATAAVAVVALVHRLTTLMPPALRERPSSEAAPTVTDSPQPFGAPRG